MAIFAAQGWQAKYHRGKRAPLPKKPFDCAGPKPDTDDRSSGRWWDASSPPHKRSRITGCTADAAVGVTISRIKTPCTLAGDGFLHGYRNRFLSHAEHTQGTPANPIMRSRCWRDADRYKTHVAGFGRLKSRTRGAVDAAVPPHPAKTGRFSVKAALQLTPMKCPTLGAPLHKNHPCNSR
ncbi:hypothetical protein SAMN05443662_1273 [Sulfurivirga caldicuralii]|uniref:Uncharacterized protein n=1 Tax=Sulfurivirga caldicuralii TaxID=364032 RepID=A0A1N6GBS5_9GAMM|nr:hypothetical protein SAMN05443662_1273 [Sulfurivirga caldicuralii]